MDRQARNISLSNAAAAGEEAKPEFETVSMDDIRKKNLRAEYGSLFDDVARLLFQTNPVGINFEENTDEYEPEARTILPRLKEAKSADDAEERFCIKNFVVGLGKPMQGQNLAAKLSLYRSGSVG